MQQPSSATDSLFVGSGESPQGVTDITFPDRFAANANFHGGSLAIDAPTSPHQLAPRIEAELYVARADSDSMDPPAMAKRLMRTLDVASVTYIAETSEGAAHGWMVTDFPVFDAVASERGWRFRCWRFSIERCAGSKLIKNAFHKLHWSLERAG